MATAPTPTLDSQVQVVKKPPQMKQLFKSHNKQMAMVLKSGERIHFFNYQFWTSNKKIVEELEAEIEAGFNFIYRDPEEMEIDPNKVDPIEEIKRQAIAEYKEKLAKASDPNNDRGNTDPGKLTPASTAALSDLMQASTGAGAVIIS